MDWFDKQERYEQRWNAGQIDSDIWKYIPGKYNEAVTDAFADSDGYWVWLDNEPGGWRAYDGGEDCGIIHEYTVADLREAIKTIKRHKQKGGES